MAYFAAQYTVTASAATITAACGFSAKKTIQQIDIKAKTGNAGVVYLGASNVTNVPANAGAALEAGTAWSAVPKAGSLVAVTTDDIYIVGTAADTAFITVID